VDWQEVLDHSQVGVDGMSLEELQTLVASFGVQAKVVVGEPARLDSLPVPCLVVVGSRHCIVLEGIDKLKGEASFFEPAQGEVITASLAALEAQCSGEAIVFDDTGVSSAAFLGYVVGGTAAVVALWWIVSALILLRRPAGVRSMPSSPVVPAEPAVQ
jgi:ABC-type bacteriocin/lantibiotic exporter with double-glycine peptidase domain